MVNELAVFIAVFVAYTVAWILTLINQAQNKQWAWFVLSLIFPILIFVYWVFG